jgi:hypothetical protein
MISDASAASGFVAAFSQSSVGDTTPNVLGAYCDDGSALECGTTEHSTCNGVSTDCHGRGTSNRRVFDKHTNRRQVLSSKHSILAYRVVTRLAPEFILERKHFM